MARLAALSNARYGNKFWQRFSSYAFAGQDQFAPVVVSELYRAVHAMPLCFVRRNSGFVLMGLLSPIVGENFFVNDRGQWVGTYIPAWFRGYPFRLVSQPGTENHVVCVDESSGLVSDTQGESFYEENGEPSKPLREVVEFLQKVEQNRRLTQQCVSALTDAGVIEKWPLAIPLGPKKEPVHGLYKIGEAALRAVDDETFLSLRKTGALPLAYAQLLSMGNVGFFKRLAELRRVEKPSEADLRKILGDDDIFQF